jgi:predicted RNA-binding Zn-ribbon protein involved in translation (DUF1610 family)
LMQWRYNVAMKASEGSLAFVCPVCGTQLQETM